ncbi:Copper Transporter integral membrane protein that functions in high affinity copper transport [Arthrobotrys megalospora]
MNHVKHTAHDGHSHAMDHTDMNHTEDHSVMEHEHHITTMDHSSMDHSSHSGHDHAAMMHGAGTNMCKMDVRTPFPPFPPKYSTSTSNNNNNKKMYWNWYTIDACFLSKSWHITSAAMFAGSCIGIVFLVVLVEALRRCARELDRYIVRDWKKRAVQAAEGVDVNVVGVKGVDGVDEPTTTPAAAMAGGGCCGTAASGEVSSTPTSEKAVSITKPTTTTAVHKSLFTRLCPYSSSTTTPRPTIFQHILKSFIYAVLLGVGYILMLLAMYYNGYVFFCLVIGAWLGNFLFGMDTCVLDESVVGAERGCGC